MRRSLAVLLAVMITVTALPAVSAAAAESPAEGITSVSTEQEAATETAGKVTEITATEQEPADAGATDMDAAAADPEQVEAADAGATDMDAAAAELEPVETADTAATDTETAAEAEPAETADAGATDTETAAEAEPAETADTAATDTETAAEEEPSDAVAAEEPVVIEEAAIQETLEKAKGAVNSFVNIDGKKYYFDAEGKKRSEQWLTFGEFTYYIGADGAACTGFKKIGGKTYYFKDSRGSTKYPVGAMEMGWQRVGRSSTSLTAGTRRSATSIPARCSPAGAGSAGTCITSRIPFIRRPTAAG